jgi:hypothetical protein
MNTLNSITSLALLKTHSKQLEADLAEVFARYGLKLTRNAATIWPDSGEVKFRCETSYLDAEDAAARDKHQWEQYACLYDVPVDAFGKVITVAGTEFKIVGLDGKARKSPIKLARVKDNKPFQCSADAIRRALAILQTS